MSDQLWAELAIGFRREIAGMRPIAPQPSGPVTEPCDLPTDRSDFTRDSELSGV